MQVHEIMTPKPACCSPDAAVENAAKLMAECDCGEIPVVDREGRPVGVVTDRDIACRGVAQGKRPQTSVGEVMSRPVITCSPDARIEQCLSLMEDKQIRRLPVVNGEGQVCGMISQADIARHASKDETAELVRDVSQPSSNL